MSEWHIAIVEVCHYVERTESNCSMTKFSQGEGKGLRSDRRTVDG